MSSTTIRGADIVMRTLERAGHRTIFTLSGNHIMSLFDAAIDTRHRLVHTRHEAAAVHMADAWGRLTGEPGIAMVTGGPGHANAAAALMTAQGQESPLVLLSGHTETTQLGRGGFQELRQAEVAAPMAKASWTATSAATLGVEVAKAIRIARSGRPGPVHLSLPSDLLDATVADNEVVWPQPDASVASPVALGDVTADAILGIVATAQRPFLLAGPALANRSGRDLLARVEATTQIPTAIMESPRGSNDATLGAFGDAIRRADLIILLGKALDFTLKFGEPPAVDAACRWVVIDPEAALVDRAIRERGESVVFGCVADTRPAGEALIRRAVGKPVSSEAWLAEVRYIVDRSAGIVGHAGIEDARQIASDRGVPSAAAPYRKASRHGPDLRWRRVRAMGSERAAGSAATPDQRCRWLDRFVAADGRRGTRCRARSAGVRRAGRRHVRLPHGRVRDSGAL